MDDALNRLPCGFLSFADDGVIRGINDTLLELLGYERAELEGRHIELLLPAGGRVFYHTHLFPMLKMQGRIEEIYFLLRAKDASTIPMLVYGKRTEGANECIFIHVTRREKYQSEIAQARERLIGILGHDLRVPLTSVTLGAEMLLRHETMSEEGQQTALSILASSRRAARMTTDLLDFTRARFAGGIPLQRRPADLREVAEKVISELRTIHPEVPIELTIDGDCRGKWDPDRAAQVVANLTGNAIDHRPDDAPVIVELHGLAEAVVLEVRNASDTTIANPEELFSPFHQGAGSTGLGLGLFIVREIMQAHGGSVTAAGAGGEFRVRAVWPRPV